MSERIVILVFAAVIATIVAACERARAHDAPSGWSYPSSCCSGVDCGEVPADWIEETPDGYRLVPTGEVIPYTSPKVRKPPDGRYHWCRPPNQSMPKTICLFVPQGDA